MTSFHLCSARQAALFTLSFLLSAAAWADDWPQWRGPQRDGVWRENGILEAIPAGGLKVRWRARISAGYSGPVVAQGRVYVSDHQLRTSAERPEVERVVCLEEATGKPLWAHAYPCDYANMEYGNGPRASPTVHEGKVYSLGTQGHLVCLDAAEGKLLWKKDLVKDYKARVPQYGASAAPLVEGELLIVCVGGEPEATVMAFDRNTGQERWRALKDRSAYSAPIVITAGGARQLIVWTADTITSLEPATGKTFWQVPYKATFDPAQAVASPVVHKDLLLCLAAWNRGSIMLKLDAGKPAASVLWKTRTRPSTTISTPIFQDHRHIYAIESDGSLCCLDATSGQEVWATRQATSSGYGNAHLTPIGDRVLIFNHRGHLILARLTPRGYEELGRTLLVEPTAGYRAQDPVAWAHPAYANGCVFARNDRELVCVSLAADQALDAKPPKQTITPRLLADDSEKNVARTLAFSPDGETLALGSWRGAVRVVELASSKDMPAPARHNDWVCSVSFSKDGKLLVSAGGSEFTPARNGGKTSGQIKVWDVAAKKERGQLTGHTNKVFSAAFAPDGQTLATGSADQTVRLWDVAKMAPRAELKGHAEAVSAVAFSPDGKTIVSASWDKTVRLWDAATGEHHGTLQGHEEEVLAVAVSPDGQTLATGGADWTVRLWDLPTQKQRAVLKGHQGTVYCAAFSADGKTLATGSGDETIKLWDVAAGNERTTLRGHRSGVTAVAFASGSPSSPKRTLASAGMDDAVRMWDLGRD
jgi:outer membrane protein assembly factor BamB